MKETIMSEDGKLQDGPLLSFTVRSFQFNLDLSRAFFFFSSSYIYTSAARRDPCKYLEVLLGFCADEAQCHVLYEWERLQKLIVITDLHVIPSLCILYPTILAVIESNFVGF